VKLTKINLDDVFGELFSYYVNSSSLPSLAVNAAENLRDKSLINIEGAKPRFWYDADRREVFVFFENEDGPCSDMAIFRRNGTVRVVEQDAVLDMLVYIDAANDVEIEAEEELKQLEHKNEKLQRQVNEIGADFTRERDKGIEQEEEIHRLRGRIAELESGQE
jgi:peptidoglycan hydrolase CwlO-like protein